MTPVAEDNPSAQRCAASRLALVAGAFCLLVGGVMLSVWLSGPGGEVPTSARLDALRASYMDGASEARTREQLRKEDRRVREAYHRRAALLRRGARLLLAGGVALGVAMAWLLWLRPIRPAIPKADPDAEIKRRAESRRTVATVLSIGLFVLGILLGMGWRALSQRPAPDKSAPSSEARR